MSESNNTKRERKPRSNQPATSITSEFVQQTSSEIVVKDIDPSQYITVKNGFHGKLIYKSKKTGEQYVWEGFGTEQEMDLHELRNAKNSYKKFFINNWFMFDDEWVVDYLGVSQYYKNAVNIEDFDRVFKESPSEIKAAIADMPDGQKRSLAYRAKELIASKDIDSIKAIEALEEALGVELIER